jgi:uncharacterized membrane protein
MVVVIYSQSQLLLTFSKMKIPGGAAQLRQERRHTLECMLIFCLMHNNAMIYMPLNQAMVNLFALFCLCNIANYLLFVNLCLASCCLSAWIGADE